jgi:hypothetical protein
MARRQVESSDDEDTQPSKQLEAPKPTRRSRDDVSENIQLPNRTRNPGERTASTKQLENGQLLIPLFIHLGSNLSADKENRLKASKAKIKRLQHELLKAKKHTKEVLKEQTGSFGSSSKFQLIIWHIIQTHTTNPKMMTMSKAKSLLRMKTRQ